MNLDLRTSLRRDAALLRSTLLRLTAVPKLLCASVITVVALIWYAIAGRLLAFGRSIDYDGLHTLGEHAIALMKRYNPFFWWAVVIALTLIIAYFLVGFVQSSMRSTNQRLVAAQTIRQLTQQFGAAATEVLNWAWQDRQQPITIGVLQNALREMRAGRAAKIDLAREHAALLDASLGSNPVPDPTPSPVPGKASTTSTSSAASVPASPAPQARASTARESSSPAPRDTAVTTATTAAPAAVKNSQTPPSATAAAAREPHLGNASATTDNSKPREPSIWL